MVRSLKSIAAICLFTFFAFLAPAVGQDPPTEDEALFTRASTLLNSDPETSITILRDLLTRISDREFVINTRWQIAIALDILGRKAEAMAEVDALRTQYPDLSIEFDIMELELIVPRLDSDGFQEGMQGLLTRHGAPTTEEILNDPFAAAASFEDLPVNVRRQIVDVYRAVAEGLPPSSDEAVTVFLRQNSRDYTWVDFRPDLIRLWRYDNSSADSSSFENDASGPTISPRTPSEGGMAREFVSFRLADGGPDAAQVDLQSLSIAFDSIPTTEYRIASELNLVSGANLLEQLTIEVPTAGLTPGEHEISVSAADGVGNTSVNSWKFWLDSTPGSTSIHANADSTLSQQNPHRNEGANPLLYLSHRPEVRERARNPILGFDLSQVDTTGLTKATLVLNIQECKLPRRFGRDGRYIQAQNVSQSWVEGNGKHLGLKKRKQMSGKGKGVTWFSPVDKKIQNDRPNGAQQWDGARDALLPPSGPAVLLTNGQTGEIEFDVTQDVLNGGGYGWLIRKQQEGEFGNVRFYSKEGGASPKLILEFGNGSADEGAKGRELVRHVPEAEGFYRIWPSVIRYAEELLAYTRSLVS